MTTEDRTPNPLEDPRYGIAMTAGLGLFDTAGWPGVPVQRAELTDGGRRRDYGAKGCAGLVLLPALGALLLKLRGRR